MCSLGHRLRTVNAVPRLTKPSALRGTVMGVISDSVMAMVDVDCSRGTDSLAVLFCSVAVLDPRVGHTMDVLSPFISIPCHSD